MTEIENLEQRLAAGQDAFAGSTAGGTYSNELPPDGTYQGIIKNFDFFEGKPEKGSHVYFKTIITVMFDKDWTGTDVETIHNITDRKLLEAGWLKTHLSRLGVDVDEFELDWLMPGSPTLEGLLDVPVEIAIKTSDTVNESTGQPYRNVYVNGTIGAPLQAGGEIPADTEGLVPATDPGRETDKPAF